ncbi:MAG TPA: hypothetical protein VKA65_06805 [Acidimicrobiales bacterium]|nr:hypothetical protein [Acidimicrobiales bacterium]
MRRSAVGDDALRGEGGDDPVGAGLLEDLDGDVVALGELGEEGLVGVGGELDRGPDLERAVRVGRVDDEQGGLGVADEVLVLLPVGGDGGLEQAVVVDEEPDGRRLGQAVGADGGQDRGAGLVEQVGEVRGDVAENRSDRSSPTTRTRRRAPRRVAPPSSTDGRR